VINLSNFLGSTILVTVGQALIQSRLVERLQPGFPGVDLRSLAQGDAVSIRKLARKERLPAVLSAYNDALRSVWYLSLALACLVLLASFGMEWKNVKGKKSASDAEDNQDANGTSTSFDVDNKMKKSCKTSK
jgi:hypothetical protein